MSVFRSDFPMFPSRLACKSSTGLSSFLSSRLPAVVRSIVYTRRSTSDWVLVMYFSFKSWSTTRVIAALGPKMLALGAEMTDGVHPYFVPVEHTAIAREAVGPGKIVASEQMVVLDTDPASARETARKHMKVYVGLPNYANNLMRLGFTEDEITNMDDRVVDAIVVWGTVDDIVGRVRAHQDAGASHVCIQVLRPDREPPTREWSELAAALL